MNGFLKAAGDISKYFYPATKIFVTDEYQTEVLPETGDWTHACYKNIN
jgi:hypothetical protein